jgi:hypothetical protein
MNLSVEQFETCFVSQLQSFPHFTAFVMLIINEEKRDHKFHALRAT